MSNKIGISTNIFKNPANISHVVREISNNFSIIEIEIEKDFRKALDNDMDYWNKQIYELAEIKKQKNLYFSLHAPYLGEMTDISSLNNDIRKKAVNYMIFSIRHSVNLGYKNITIHPGYLYETGTTNKLEYLFDNLCRSLSDITKVTNDLGGNILLENTGNNRPRYIVLDNHHYDYLYNEYGIYVTMDIVHYHSFHHENREDYYHDLEDMIKYVKNAHFNDLRDGKHTHIPLGEGNFQYHQFIEHMTSKGYQGNFIVEETGVGYSAQNYIDASIKYRDSLYEAA
mgnify:FL=1